MSPRRTLATSRRVLQQLRHDPRTIALVVLVPSVLLTILKYMLNSDSAIFSSFAVMFLGIFPFILMFIVTSITTLRERTAGTLERLMTTPMAKLDFLFGYGLAFSIVALAQGLVTSAITLTWLGVTVQGGTVRVLVFVILGGLVGETLGLFMSAFATSEFQAVQFMPALIFPQLLTAGVFVPRTDMAKPLQWFADVMPLTYLVDALKKVTANTGWSNDLTKDAVILAAYIVGALILGTLTLRRSR